MSEQKPTVEQILQLMAKNLGEEPRPMVLMSKVLPEWIPKQAQERKFVFDLPHIPAKYKHLIMIAVAASSSCDLCTETFIKIAKREGVSKEEIGEALIAARFALASTIFAAATDGLEHLTKEGKE
ncbi:MAG: carboxymuconolactone decarboxylase family protein [Candidatus Bathyarchaeia archaeon]|jgi:AhpD family alkylhydroperoxidase